jgi:hypothetical protein
MLQRAPIVSLTRHAASMTAPLFGRPHLYKDQVMQDVEAVLQRSHACGRRRWRLCPVCSNTASFTKAPTKQSSCMHAIRTVTVSTIGLLLRALVPVSSSNHKTRVNVCSTPSRYWSVWLIEMPGGQFCWVSRPLRKMPIQSLVSDRMVCLWLWGERVSARGFNADVLASPGCMHSPAAPLLLLHPCSTATVPSSHSHLMGI